MSDVHVQRDSCYFFPTFSPTSNLVVLKAAWLVCRGRLVLTSCQPFSCISGSAIALLALFLFALDLFTFSFALYFVSFPTAVCPFPFISLLPSRLHVFFVARWFWIMGLVSRFIATICL
jgi:hypothetical protein